MAEPQDQNIEIGSKSGGPQHPTSPQPQQSDAANETQPQQSSPVKITAVNAEQTLDVKSQSDVQNQEGSADRDGVNNPPYHLSEITALSGDDSEQESALHAAARAGRAHEVEKLLQDPQIDANGKNWAGKTALQVAAQNNSFHVVEKMLKSGKFDIDACDVLGWTALHFAAYWGYIDVVRVLLATHADARILDEDGETALHLAVENGNFQIAKMLKQFSDLDARDTNGRTPLYVAAKFDRVRIAKLLLSGLDESGEGDEQPGGVQVDGDGEIFHGESEEGGDGEGRVDDDGETTSEDHAELSDEEDYEPGKNDTKINTLELTTEDLKWTPFHRACWNGNIKIARLLRAHGSNIEAKDVDIRTPLQLAASKGHAKVVEWLLFKAKADPNAINLKDETALYLAAKEIAPNIHSSDGQKRDEDFNDSASIDRDDAASEIPTDEGDSQPQFSLVIEHLINAMEDRDRMCELLRLVSRENEDTIWKFLFEKMSKFLEWSGQTTLENQRQLGFIWLARKKEPPEKLMELLEDEPAAKAQLRESESAKKWTVLEWSAYLGDYATVWWLIKGDTEYGWFPDEERDSAMKIVAKRQLENNRGGNQPAQVKQSTVKGTQAAVHAKDGNENRRHDAKQDLKIEPQPTQDKWDITLDILNDPPLMVKGKEPQINYRSPGLPKALSEYKEKINGTVVDFYCQDGRVDFLRQSAEVSRLIYREGPDAVMESAMKVLKDISPGDYTKGGYTKDNFCFRWIHLPANSMDWMTDLMTVIYLKKDKKEEEYKAAKMFTQKSWQTLPGSSSHAFNIIPWCATEVVDVHSPNTTDDATQTSTDDSARQQIEENTQTMSTQMTDNASGNTSPETGSKKIFPRAALYMPYITFGTYRDNENSEQEDTLQKLYKNKMSESRTLDQFYYYSLPNTNPRDHDQVVTKYIYEELDRERGGCFEILRVDQLWLWIIDENTIITSSTRRLDIKKDPVLEEVLEHLRESKFKNNGHSPPSDVHEMSTLIAWQCIKFISHLTLEKLKLQTPITDAKAGLSKLTIRQIFADVLNKRTGKEATLLQDFVSKVDKTVENLKKKRISKGGIGAQGHSQKERKDIASKDRPIDQPGLAGEGPSSDEGKSTVEEGPTKWTNEELDYISISTTSHLLQEINDIRDELEILSFLLNQQKEVWTRLVASTLAVKTAEESHDIRKESRKAYQLRNCDQLIRDIEEMVKTAKRIQDSVNSILSLEQNEASLSEAEQSRKLTLETVKQGKTLMVFTIITIVFLPLSFLTSLYALNITAFPHENGGVLYKSRLIFPIIFGPAFAFSLLVILPVFYKDAIFNRPEKPKGPDSGGGRSATVIPSLPSVSMGNEQPMPQTSTGTATNEIQNRMPWSMDTINYLLRHHRQI